MSSKRAMSAILNIISNTSSESLYCIALAVAASGDDDLYIMADESHLVIVRYQSSNNLGRVYFLMDGSFSGSISIVQCG